MQSKISAALIVLGIVAGCAPEISTSLHTPDGERTVEVALLEYLIREREPPAGRIICIGLPMLRQQGYESRDPSAALLSHFERGAEKVVPASECRLRDEFGPMIHAPSGARAVKYEVTVFNVDGDRADLMGAWYAASLAGEGCTYKARKDRNRGWIFVAEEPCSVS